MVQSRDLDDALRVSKREEALRASEAEKLDGVRRDPNIQALRMFVAEHAPLATADALGEDSAALGFVAAEARLILLPPVADRIGDGALRRDLGLITRLWIEAIANDRENGRPWEQQFSRTKIKGRPLVEPITPPLFKYEIGQRSTFPQILDAIQIGQRAEAAGDLKFAEKANALIRHAHAQLMRPGQTLLTWFEGSPLPEYRRQAAAFRKFEPPALRPLPPERPISEAHPVRSTEPLRLFEP